MGKLKLLLGGTLYILGMIMIDSGAPVGGFVVLMTGVVLLALVMSRW